MIPQTRWVDRSFRFDFDAGLFPVIFSRLEGSLFRLYSLLANADDETCSQRTEGWTVKEQLGHLSDLEELWWKRLEDFRAGKPTFTPADITNPRTTAAGHNEKMLHQLLEQFTLERQKLLEEVYPYTEETLLLTSIHPRLQQPMRVIDHLYFVAEHDDHHIAIISDRLRKPVE